MTCESCRERKTRRQQRRCRSSVQQFQCFDDICRAQMNRIDSILSSVVNDPEPGAGEQREHRADQ